MENMKKIFTIIIASAAFIGSLSTAIWYTLDSDPATNADIQKVVDDAKVLYNTAVSDVETSASATDKSE